MKQGYILSLLFAGCQLMATAQPQLPAKVTAKRPVVVIPKNGIIKKAELENELAPGTKWGQLKTVNEFWIVYSDRDKNVVYTSSDKSAKATKTLNFGERVIIAEIKGDMALVYTDNKAEKFPDIPSYAKSVGWVPMEHLLLWNTCPTDSRGVLRKALIAINLNKMKQGERFKGRLFKSPTDHIQNEPLSMDMNFYFIMKETPDGEQALLCLNPTYMGNNLYGWVANNSFTRWSQRTCLEPNWNFAYAQKNKGRESFVYMTNDFLDGDKITHWTYGQPNGDTERSMQYRMKPSQLRFPIIDKPNYEKNYVHCTSFADRTGSSNLAGSFHGDINDQVNTKRRKMQQMNLIFVVEASTEMSNYLPAIKTSLAKCKSFANQDVTVQAGVVMYRSSADGAAGIDVVPLSNYDDSRLMSMFDASKASGELVGEDRSVALSQAIESAIDKSKMGFSADNSNLLIIIGGRGTAESDDALEDPSLIRKLTTNRIQLMSVQTMRNETGSWARYSDQINSLIKKNVDAQYKEIGATSKFREYSSNDGYSFRSSRENVLFATTRYPATMGQGLAPATLTKYLDNGINDFAKSVTTSQDTYEKALNDIDFYPEFLKLILGEKGYNSWKDVKAISAYDGYAKLKDEAGGDYWHYILFLSSGELQHLISELKGTYEAALVGDNDRSKYVDAMRALIKKMFADDITDKRLETMSTEEIEETIYGLNVPTESMNNMRSKFTLKDIANTNVVSKPDYLEILDTFKKKYESLTKLRGNMKYRLDIGKDTYYWIPIEEVP